MKADKIEESKVYELKIGRNITTVKVVRIERRVNGQLALRRVIRNIGGEIFCRFILLSSNGSKIGLPSKIRNRTNYCFPSPNAPAVSNGNHQIMIQYDLEAARTFWIAESENPAEEEKRLTTNFLLYRNESGLFAALNDYGIVCGTRL